MLIWHTQQRRHGGPENMAGVSSRITKVSGGCATVRREAAERASALVVASRRAGLTYSWRRAGDAADDAEA